VIRAFNNRSNAGMRAVWISLFILTIAGVLANTSRMSQVVALLLFFAICAQFGPALLRKLSGSKKSVALAGGLAILLALTALAQAVHPEQTLNRWQTESHRISGDARWRAFRVAMGAMPDALLCGFGPGTFRVVFPGYNIASTNEAPGSWRFLHDDYMQTVLEWGLVGSSLWALLFFGGIAIGVRSYYRHGRAWRPRRRLLQLLLIMALFGVALHALVDFPLQIESIQLYVATYLGICWGSALWPPHEGGRSNSILEKRTSHGAGSR
jgi:hypothetical protein